MKRSHSTAWNSVIHDIKNLVVPDAKELAHLLVSEKEIPGIVRLWLGMYILSHLKPDGKLLRRHQRNLVRDIYQEAIKNNMKRKDAIEFISKQIHKSPKTIEGYIDSPRE